MGLWTPLPRGHLSEFAQSQALHGPAKGMWPACGWPNLVANPAPRHPRTEASALQAPVLAGGARFGFGWSSLSEAKPLLQLIRI